jgi:hypothetical protein
MVRMSGFLDRFRLLAKRELKSIERCGTLCNTGMLETAAPYNGLTF